MFAVNPKPKGIKFTVSELGELCMYLTKCIGEAFDKDSYTHRQHIQREYLIRWHLIEILQRLVYLSVRNHLYNKSKLVSLRLSEAERHVLSILFNRVDCSPLMLVIQEKIIKNLQKL